MERGRRFLGRFVYSSPQLIQLDTHEAGASQIIWVSTFYEEEMRSDAEQKFKLQGAESMLSQYATGKILAMFTRFVGLS